jgi:hypothetical protein
MEVPEKTLMSRRKFQQDIDTRWQRSCNRTRLEEQRLRIAILGQRLMIEVRPLNWPTKGVEK